MGAQGKEKEHSGSRQVFENTGLEGRWDEMEDGLLVPLWMQWVQLQTDRDAKIMEFPGSTGRGRAVCRLSIRRGPEGRIQG